MEAQIRPRRMPKVRYAGGDSVAFLVEILLQKMFLVMANQLRKPITCSSFSQLFFRYDYY